MRRGCGSCWVPGVERSAQAAGNQNGGGVAAVMGRPAAYRWIKTDCGRAKYAELAARSGVLARLRLGWFLLIAALRDWRLPDPG